MKENKEFESPENKENKISSNEINEVLEEAERQYNKSPDSKREELKDNMKKTYRNAIMEYKMNGNEE